MTVDEILGENGAVAERLSDYEIRPEQLAMEVMTPIRRAVALRLPPQPAYPSPQSSA